MKKIIGLMIVVLVLMLSACDGNINGQVIVECGEDSYGQVEDIGNGQLIVECYPFEDGYTQSEVNQLLDQQARDIMDLMYDNYVEYDDFNNMLYSNCEIIEGIKQCQIVINLNENSVILTESEYHDLLNRITELESVE